MDLLGPAYAAITGHFPDGTPFERRKVRSRSRVASWEESPAALRALLESDDESVSYCSNNEKGRPLYVCHKGISSEGWTLANKVGIMRQQIAWSVACEDLDHLVIDRLSELARYDGDMSDRIKAIWEGRRNEEVNEAQVLKTQIESAEAQIRRLDKLLTDPASPLSADAERRYIAMLREAEAEVQRLLRKKAERG